jgi:indolepyruvate ferredoxin oxidoreductase
LRGTPFDIFGYGATRREERSLIIWYIDTVSLALAKMNAGNIDLVREIVELPDGIRGYEEIKLKSAAAVRERAAELMKSLSAGKGTRKAA